MAVMYKQQPSCFPTNRTSQPTPVKFFQYSIPINNYPSVQLASTIPTPRKWGEHETNFQENTYNGVSGLPSESRMVNGNAAVSVVKKRFTVAFFC